MFATETETFWIASRLVVSDPCYIDTDDGATFDEVVKDRKYVAVIEKARGHWRADISFDDNCVSELLLINEDVPRSHTSRTDYIALAVDSGQMWAGPSASLPLDYEELLDHYTDEDRLFATEDLFDWKGGVISATGYGDGSYEAEVQYVEVDGKEKPASVKIKFIVDLCENCNQEREWCECCPDCGEGPDWCRCDEEDEDEEEV